MGILYKYVNASRALDCIPEVGDGTLRATQPASLNDPFECAVAPIYVIADPAEEERLLADALTKINQNVPVTEEDVHKARQEYGSLFTSQLLAKQVSTKLGIVSFAADPFHPLMWSHYTVDGAGFAIGYDQQALKELVHGDGDLVQVRYRDTPPIIIGPNVVASPRTNLSVLLSSKSDLWDYENEWRLIVEMNNTIGTGKNDRHQQPINLVRIPNEAVVRVYHTERTPPESVQAVRGRLSDPNNRYRAKGPRKLTMSSTSYRYVETQE